jgi:ATP-dependent DNA helicase RecG
MTMDLETLIERLNIGETSEFECKASETEVPKDAWKTISAFANTNGGYIVLGITEKKGNFDPTGVKNSSYQIQNFWNAHNDPTKLSFPIVNESDVNVLTIEDKSIIIIKVPRASRTQRPVYINNNPKTGTYKRNYTGDYICSLSEVRKMLRDASEETADAQILDNFNLDDLDLGTINSFRQRFRNKTPDHHWLGFDDRNLLIQLGGWLRDRENNREGLTLAGLLMFGKERSILDAVPNYQLDYQEQLAEDPEIRWSDRVTIDGTWVPNIYNFYYSIYPRLVSELKVPFQLKDSVRQDETHVHEAIREALSNTIIHADHLSEYPIKITKKKDEFIFENPGRLRISREQLYEGGISAPRNPNLQKMFQMLGLGDKAGSGFGKILRAWSEQQWAKPLATENHDLEMTKVSLSMMSLIPEYIEKEIRNIVGDRYSELNERERTILVLAHKLGNISNIDVRGYISDHRRDIGDSLKHLVNNGWLEQSGHGPSTHYCLATVEPNSDSLADSSDSLADSSDSLADSSDSLADSSDSLADLIAIAAPIRAKGKVTPELMEQVILQVCDGRFLTQIELAQILDRSAVRLRTAFLKKMVENKSLELKYPDKPTHPEQAYRSKKT